MMRFRVTHLEPKRAVLTHHGEDGVTARMEIGAPEGGLDEYLHDGQFLQLLMEPEGEPEDKPIEVTIERVYAATTAAIREVVSAKDPATGETHIAQSIEQRTAIEQALLNGADLAPTPDHE